MTTTVTIMSPVNNHHHVGVVQETLGAEGQPIGAFSMIVLQDGQSTTQYVHGNNRLVITEIDRKPATQAHEE